MPPTPSPAWPASATPPDLIRLPTLGDTVRDGLVANLDPYFDAYGWDAWPASQLAPLRITAARPGASVTSAPSIEP